MKTEIQKRKTPKVSMKNYIGDYPVIASYEDKDGKKAFAIFNKFNELKYPSAYIINIDSEMNFKIGIGRYVLFKQLDGLDPETETHIADWEVLTKEEIIILSNN